MDTASKSLLPKRKMSFYHWTEDQYFKSFQQTDLSVVHRENITQEVIRGYKDSGNWIQSRYVNNYFTYMLLKLFVFVQVKMNVFLLHNRRKYLIFYGMKNAN